MRLVRLLNLLRAEAVVVIIVVLCPEVVVRVLQVCGDA